MFIGEHSHNVDEKGRLQVPVKWRSKLAEGVVITKGFDGSLACYPATEWAVKAQALSSLPQSDPNARAYVRQTLAGAVDCELDKLGRVIIPSYLREYAFIKKGVVLAGLNSTFEIWDAARWNEYQQSVDTSTSSFTQSLKEVGL